MADLALLDLLNPPLAWLDGVLSGGLSLAPVWRIAFFAALASGVSMWLFKRLSDQDELARLKAAIADVQAELVRSVAMRESLVRNFRLTGRQLWLSFWPALLASLPVLFLLAFSSNQFGVEAAKPGSRVYVTPTGLQNSPSDYEWRGVNAQWDARRNAWTFYQPESGQTATLLLGEQQQLSLPTAVATRVLHKKYGWNYLIANPAGYLEDEAAVERFDFNTPTQVIIDWGPGWMRGWLFAFVLFLIAFSLLIKRVWKIE